jgi:hypothetical protein
MWWNTHVFLAPDRRALPLDWELPPLLLHPLNSHSPGAGRISFLLQVWDLEN